MKNKSTYLLLILISFVCLSFIGPENGYFVYLYGKKQFVNVEGTSSPTLVFITGKGTSGNDFNKVFNKLKKTHRCFSYDRAGLGQSKALPTDRRVDTMACELYQLLQKEKIKPPYILVAHSMGTYIARCFASQYPLTVNAMMLIEPAHEYEFKNGLEIRNDSDKIVFKSQYKSFLKVKGRTKTQNDEAKYCFDFDSAGFSTNQHIVKKVTLPLTLPITILLSLQPDVENIYIEKELEYRTTFFENWKLENNTIQVFKTYKAGHFIHHDEPNWVADEVMALIKKSKK